MALQASPHIHSVVIKPAFAPLLHDEVSVVAELALSLVQTDIFGEGGGDHQKLTTSTPALACKQLANKLASHTIKVDLYKKDVHLLVEESEPCVTGFRTRAYSFDIYTAPVKRCNSNRLPTAYPIMVKRYGAAPECKRDPRENPPTSGMSGTIPTCENSRVTPPGVEPVSPRWGSSKICCGTTVLTKSGDWKSISPREIRFLWQSRTGPDADGCARFPHTKEAGQRARFARKTRRNRVGARSPPGRQGVRKGVGTNATRKDLALMAGVDSEGSNCRPSIGARVRAANGPSGGAPSPRILNAAIWLGSTVKWRGALYPVLPRSPPGGTNYRRGRRKFTLFSLSLLALSKAASNSGSSWLPVGKKGRSVLSEFNTTVRGGASLPRRSSVANQRRGWRRERAQLTTCSHTRARASATCAEFGTSLGRRRPADANNPQGESIVTSLHVGGGRGKVEGGWGENMNSLENFSPIPTHPARRGLALWGKRHGPFKTDTGPLGSSAKEISSWSGCKRGVKDWDSLTEGDPAYFSSKRIYGMVRSFSAISYAALKRSLSRLSPAKTNRVQSPTGSSNFRKWESCRTMPLVGEFSRGSPFPPHLHSSAAPYSLQSSASAFKTSLAAISGKAGPPATQSAAQLAPQSLHNCGANLVL
ncbi:hypothetical protein PR048_006113 [Dryococelus australis]|uniref:Uncharacterized protein n=1 Tax=Dryococelus australis TaxID=614101 RepID=A0ABQ9IB93_9NEOP|nr:hypothetical protein PR048_006113 [Dryococelus australis]